MKSKKNNKGQIGVEYLIIVGFVTFVVISLFLLAYLYSGIIRDRIRTSQLDAFAVKIIDVSEEVYYSGEPSLSTIKAYLPENVKTIEIQDDNLIFTLETSSGITKTAYSSKVPISGSFTAVPGIKKLKIKAEADKVEISQV